MISSIEPTMEFPSVADMTSRLVSSVTLKSGTIDLWSASLQGNAEVLERCQAWLSKEERARAGRFVRPEDQTRFILAHGGLRHVLGQYLRVNAAELRFFAGPNGKPALLNEQGGPHVLRFNLSHSHGRMLLAVSNGQEVGIDLEQIRNKVEPLKLAERFYSAGEYQEIKNRPLAEHALEFYRLWVAKEAVLKAQGIGIPSLQQCEIVVSSVPFRADVRVMPDSAVQQGWTIQWLSCGSGWRGAVSAFGNGWSVRVLDGGCG
jgi:4'-phosphopantetheinyl transferase